MTKQFDVREFEAFCRSKPAGERYVWFDRHQCALGQFGFEEAFVSDNFSDDVLEAAMTEPFTFGALADRLSRIGQ